MINIVRVEVGSISILNIVFKLLNNLIKLIMDIEDMLLFLNNNEW